MITDPSERKAAEAYKVEKISITSKSLLGPSKSTFELSRPKVKTEPSESKKANPLLVLPSLEL